MGLEAVSVDRGVPQALSRMMGAEPTSMRQLTAGYSDSRTYLTEIANSMVVVKVGDDPYALANAVQNLETLAELAIRVPRDQRRFECRRGSIYALPWITCEPTTRSLQEADHLSRKTCSGLNDDKTRSDSHPACRGAFMPEIARGVMPASLSCTVR
jgi:hypothetical protein